MAKKNIGVKSKVTSADFKMATPTSTTGKRRVSVHGTPAASTVAKRNGPTASSSSDSHKNRAVIVNELLCYAWNKLDILPYDTIVKLCCDVFNDEEVEDAKSVLFDLCESDSRRRITRKGADKRKHNLHDILNLLHETDPSDIPCFAACDLSKLPPVHYNHMDMSAILKELALVKGDIAELKLAQVATLETCCDQFKANGPTTSNGLGVATPPGPGGVRDTSTLQRVTGHIATDAAGMQSCMADLAGGASDCTRAGDRDIASVVDLAAGSQECSDTTTCGENNATSVASTDEPEKEDGELDDSITEVKQLLVSAVTGGPPARTSSPSFAGLAANLAVHGMRPRPSPRVSDDEFTTVVHKRKKPVVIGTGARSSALRGVKSGLVSTPPTAAAFVTRLAPGTTEAEICDHVRSVFGIDACCEELKTRYDTYASFNCESA